MNLIKVGTLVECRNALNVIPQIMDYGFESYSLFFSDTTAGIDLPETAKKIRALLDEKGICISSLTMFGNPLSKDAVSVETAESWGRLIDHAHLFGADVVSGFTGRIPGEPIDVSIPRFKEVFGELARRAQDKGVKLAFENCSMRGDWQTGQWNIAHGPAAWEMMFDAVPYENVGLEWEPCHQLVLLMDPIPQLRKWAKKVFHVHGKDATIAWDVIKEYGIGGPKEFAWHRTPGFGDTNWTDVISILMQAGYQGTIDIEGWHDPVYVNDLEMTGQVHALNYLKNCRGGCFAANPK